MALQVLGGICADGQVPEESSSRDCYRRRALLPGSHQNLRLARGSDDPLVPNDHRPTPLGEGQVGVLLADFLEYGPQVVSFEQLSQGPTTLGR